jgi:glucose/arabinose dehydrogenase
MVEVAVAGRTVSVPRGFTVEVYAEGLPGARWLALGPDGLPYVSQPSAGRVIRLPDDDGDGRADSVVDVVTGLDRPHGLAFRGDTLYVAETGRVVRLVPGVATPQVMVDGLPTGGHWTKTLVFGPDGMLFVSIGSSCNVCDEADPRRAAVMRYRADGSAAERFAWGLRNSVGLAFHPVTGELWATNNDRDWLGDDLPPERINILRVGRYYGWPECYLPLASNPEYPDAACSGVEPPAIAFQAHSAPLGIAFYTADRFPPEFRGDAFMAYHGSWNRTVPTGYKLVHVNVVAGRPESIRDFVTGFRTATGETWARPVSLLVMPDGTLLVSDDHGGRVFRVRYVGP